MVQNAFLAIVVLVLSASACLAQQRLPGLSPGQQSQLKSMAEETRKETERARGDISRARRELAQVYAVYELDDEKASTLLRRINAAQQTLLDTHFESQIALRNILSQDQFEAMRKRMGRGGKHQSPEDSALGPSVDERRFRGLGIEREHMNRLAKSRSEEATTLERLRRESQKLLTAYSEYDLDESEAKRLITSIHSEQVRLSLMSKSRQQTIRNSLTREQFERFVRSEQRPGQRRSR